MAGDPIDRVFSRIYSEPCWGVRQGFGSSLVLEFGQPRLKITEGLKTSGPPVQGRLPRRLALVRGSYSLYLWDCRWYYFRGNDAVGDWRAPSRIDKAVQDLNGQRLCKVTVEPTASTSRFDFDLDGCLQTKPQTPRDDDATQWDLFCPGGRVLSYRADGKWAYAPGTTPGSELRWKTLK